MTKWIRQVLQILLHLEDTPHRTALAFGIGVWIAFFPLWGIHTAMALGIGVLFRLNRAALMLGAWINNPWTMAPLYTAGTALGCALVGTSPAGFHDIDWGLHGTAFLGTLFSVLKPYLWPFILGNTVLGVLVGSVAYVVLRRILERRALSPASGV
jgi:uncharacterized protein (DUF2062 family)